MQISLTNDRIRAAIAAVGAGEPEPGKLHIVGIRGAIPKGPTGLLVGDNTIDRYNDAIILFGTHLQAFLGSVDPGRWYTERPLHPDGCAHLINGGPYEFELGPHKGKPALRQAEPFPFWRDADKDFERDLTPKEARIRREVIGLDLHPGGSSPVVGPNSAACQIIWGGWDGAPWQTFYRLCVASGQHRFQYWLLNAGDLK